MFARTITIEFESSGARKPCQLKWLDSFSMRNFTNDAVFDDTLPISDGVMEVGARVPLEALRSALEAWLRKKSYIGQRDRLIVSEMTR
jgi:hypothetical protein